LRKRQKRAWRGAAKRPQNWLVWIPRKRQRIPAFVRWTRCWGALTAADEPRRSRREGATAARRGPLLAENADLSQRLRAARLARCPAQPASSSRARDADL